jgi:catechol 2,3-dioxygenase-like lactoylglutathione lyase family enzyme
MIKTYGLTHLALTVRDVERSFRFYQQVFGAVKVYRGEG